MKKLFNLLIFFYLLSACTPALQPTPTPQPTKTSAPTATSLPRPTPLIEFSIEHFSFPVAFEGEYALDHDLIYGPCYHWDGSMKISSEEWWNQFHAGDMYILNQSSTPQRIVVVSPVSGKIIYVGGGDKGLVITIATDYLFEGKEVYVEIAHMDKLFLGDESYPNIKKGSLINKGQPIGISERVYKHGRYEQILDIAIRNGPEGPHPPSSNFSPESYLDPFIFLEDDIKQFESYFSFDSGIYVGHCILSGHHP